MRLGRLSSDLSHRSSSSGLSGVHSGVSVRRRFRRSSRGNSPDSDVSRISLHHVRPGQHAGNVDPRSLQSQWRDRVEQRILPGGVQQDGG